MPIFNVRKHESLLGEGRGGEVRGGEGRERPNNVLLVLSCFKTYKLFSTPRSKMLYFLILGHTIESV